MLSSPAFFAEVCTVFGLGGPVSSPLPVSGGLSNRLYRLETRSGVFAVKQMVVNAETEAFKSNVEAAYGVEQRALAAGIAMPTPVPVVTTGEALARISDGEAFHWVRVHQWVAARPLDPTEIQPGDVAAIAGILATLHQLAAPGDHERLTEPPKRDWLAALPEALASTSLMEAIGSMEEIVRAGYPEAGTARVMSHRDLDPKNVLRAGNGDLLLVDWDAAGSVVAAWDLVSTALDWSDARSQTVSNAAFDRFLSSYAMAGGQVAPLTIGSFAGWCEGVLDWLWFNLGRAASTDPGERQLGAAEATHSAHFIPTAAHWIGSHAR